MPWPISRLGELDRGIPRCSVTMTGPGESPIAFDDAARWTWTPCATLGGLFFGTDRPAFPDSAHAALHLDEISTEPRD